MTIPDFSKELHVIGSEIRRLRSARGLSQESFADLCGLDRTYIGGVERGERNISLINLLKISHALNISLSDLFSCVNGSRTNA